MVGLAVSLLLRLGLSQAKADRFAPWVLVLAGIALLGALAASLLLWDREDDRRAVTADRTAARSEAQEKQIGAERSAGAAKAVRDRDDAVKQEHLEKRIDEANRNGGTAADDVWNNGLWDQ